MSGTSSTAGRCPRTGSPSSWGRTTPGRGRRRRRRRRRGGGGGGDDDDRDVVPAAPAGMEHDRIRHRRRGGLRRGLVGVPQGQFVLVRGGIRSGGRGRGDGDVHDGRRRRGGRCQRRSFRRSIEDTAPARSRHPHLPRPDSALAAGDRADFLQQTHTAGMTPPPPFHIRAPAVGGCILRPSATRPRPTRHGVVRSDRKSVVPLRQLPPVIIIIIIGTHYLERKQVNTRKT